MNDRSDGEDEANSQAINVEPRLFPGSGFQPVMMRAHARACALSVQLDGCRELTAPQPT